MSGRINNILSTLPNLPSSISSLSDHPRSLILTSASAILLGLALPSAYRDYQDYLAVGPGGPPYNIFGWLFVRLIFAPFRREMFGTQIYAKKVRDGKWESYLEDEEIGMREEGRPVMGKSVVPQRQMSQLPTEEIREKLHASFRDLASRNPHLLTLGLSQLERHTDALFVAPSVQPRTAVATQLRNEIVHLHGTSDHSIHIVLSPADCKRVLEKNWGQRFPLSGSDAFPYISLGRAPALPDEYIFVYAPRNEDELRTVMNIVWAGVKYVTGVEDLK